MSRHVLDERIPAVSLWLPRSHSRVRKISTLSLMTALWLHGVTKPPTLSAVTNEGQSQANTGQAYPRPYFGYPPNPGKPDSFKEEAKAIGRVQTAFTKYARACVELFTPEFIGLKGAVPVTPEVSEMLGWSGAEGLLDAGSFAGAISEASLLMSLPDSELSDW